MAETTTIETKVILWHRNSEHQNNEDRPKVRAESDSDNDNQKLKKIRRHLKNYFVLWIFVVWWGKRTETSVHLT